MGIDAVAAVTGWHNSRNPRPEIDGVVVCAENADLLQAAYVERQIYLFKRSHLNKFREISLRWMRLINSLRNFRRLKEKNKPLD